MAKIHFRADGGSSIGLGHLMRSLALAQMLDSLFDVHFHCKDAPESFIAELKVLGYHFHRLADEAQFLDAIHQGDKVVIDHYGLGIETHQQVRAKGAYLACIDDLHDKPFDADLIINHAPGVKASDYQAKPYTQFALGPEYALLRPEFLAAAREHHKREINRNLLICFGGADFNNLTCQALKALQDNDFFAHIRVITGSAFAFKEELTELVKQDPRVQWHENQSAPEMLAHMQACTFALAPASSIAYELLAAGCIWLGGYYVENQRNIYEGFKSLGALVDMGDLNESFKTKFEDCNTLISALSSDFTSIINGQSYINILKFFLNKDYLILRRATFDDAELLFKWANDQDVRNNAINSQIIKWEEHIRWLKSRLSSNSVEIYILEFEQRALGQIRIELNDGFWQIDYSVDNNFRYLGLGKFMIDYIKNSLSKYKKISGLVKSENKASMKVFLNAGFQIKDEIEINNLKLTLFELLA